MWRPAVNRPLPGGQRQRVAIGRAMVRDLKAFLMDEPLSNLDAKLRNQIQAEIIKLRQRINTTFIYVTHDQTEAMTLGDRIVIMKNGFVNRIGAPTEVFDKSVNLFDAGFIRMPVMIFFFGCRLPLENDVRVPAPCRIPLLGRTLFGMAAVFCNYYAIDHLPLASSNSLNKLAPFFAIFFAALFLKERVERGQLACLLVALTGSLFFPPRNGILAHAVGRSIKADSHGRQPACENLP